MYTLQARNTAAATATGADRDLGKGVRRLIVVLEIFSAERDSANETYDVYITSGAGTARWDIAHFPQIATTGAKRYVAPIYAEFAPVAEVTTAPPGVSANSPGCMKVDSAGSAEGIKTLAAGEVRHGALGEFIGHEIVIAGTVATGIDYAITVYEQ